MKVEVYLLDDDSGSPSDGKLLSDGQETFGYAGYHRISLDEAVLVPKDAGYSVVATETLNGITAMPMSVGLDKTADIADGTIYTIYTVAVVNEGESFLFDGTDWYDWKDCKGDFEEALNDKFADVIENTDEDPQSLILDNHPIKVYADPAASLPSDVSLDEWYAGNVQYALNKGLMRTFDGLFRSGDAVDVNDLKYAVRTMGFENTDQLYSDIPEAGALNREQIATVLYRCAQASGLGFEGEWMFLLDYEDADQISEYADEAMHWMVMHGVINGTESGLEPKGSATRAQFATILNRFVDDVHMI